MKPILGQPVVVQGGMDNSLSEHAAVVTFVHKSGLSTNSGQGHFVNVRVFLDGHPADRVLKAIPFVSSKEVAVDLNARGAGYACYPLWHDTPIDFEVIADPQAIKPTFYAGVS